MKRLLTVLGLVAVVNLAGLIGLGVYAHGQGWTERERVLRALAALKGEEEAESAATQPETREHQLAQPSAERIRLKEETEERYLIELSRREREVQDAWKLLETQQLALVREKEGLEEAKKRFVAEMQAKAKETDDSGLQKELDIIAGVKAKEAKELLRQKNDADVVRILMAMESRKARQIVASCKGSEERLWIGRILDKLHERDATQAEALGAGT
jgi:flagellar motility protein MotE (MotC chaperone)